jgi:hypothetical protein
MPVDAKEAAGHGVRAKRATQRDLIELEFLPVI